MVFFAMITGQALFVLRKEEDAKYISCWFRFFFSCDIYTVSRASVSHRNKNHIILGSHVLCDLNLCVINMV